MNSESIQSEVHEVERPDPSASTEPAPLEHKLAAILYADVAGYSRLTGEDEEGTHRILRAYLDAFTAAIQAHHGTVKHYAGDAVLADFPTVSDALNCAVAIQRDLKARNEALPEARRLQFRIGVNLGEVIVDGGEVYGNGVNVAARLESLAEPGGICVSGTVVDAIGTMLPLGYEYLGEQQVKNIDKPVRAYHVNFTGEPSGKAQPVKQPDQPTGKPKRRGVLIAAAVGLIVLAAVGAWQMSVPRSTSVSSAADPVLAMPTGPSIAVLPFTNISGDPKEEYFADGLTEDIITELARFRDLYVLARNTTFQYKGQAVDIPAVGKKLNVRYVLEGSVRRSNDQLRIAAQLIDVASGAHVWGEKYDRKLVDLFGVQDEIANKIVATVAGGEQSVLDRAGREAAHRKSPDQLEAYDHVLRAVMALEWWGKDYAKSKAHLQKAIELDPKYARAREQYAYLMLIGWIFRFEKTPVPPSEIKRNAIRAVELDGNDPLARRTAAFGYFFDKQLDRFEQQARAALDLAPNNAQLLGELGFLYAVSGQWERGIQLVTKGHNLNAESAGGWYYSAMFYDLYHKGQYKEALEIMKQHPSQWLCENQQKCVAVYAELGDLAKAHEHWNKCIEVEPDWSATRLRDIANLWNVPKPFQQRYMESIAKAGYVVEK